MTKSIAERIKQARLAAGLNKNQLAEKVGVSPVAVSKWESGDSKNLKLDNLLTLSKALDITDIEWLITGKTHKGNIKLAHSEEPLDLHIKPLVMQKALSWIETDYKKTYSKASTQEKAVIISELYELFADAMAEDIPTKTALRVVQLATK